MGIPVRRTYSHLKPQVPTGVSVLKSSWRHIKHMGAVFNFIISTKNSLCNKYDVHIQNNRSNIVHVVTLISWRNTCWNNASKYTPRFEPHSKLIFRATMYFLLKFSQNYSWNNVHPDNRKKTFWSKMSKWLFCVNSTQRVTRLIFQLCKFNNYRTTPPHYFQLLGLLLKELPLNLYFNAYR